MHQKIENSFLAIFDKIPCTIDRVFGQIFDQLQKSIFDRNQLKISEQHKDMYMLKK